MVYMLRLSKLYTLTRMRVMSVTRRGDDQGVQNRKILACGLMN
jgi:hypothetical protein